MSKPSKNKKNKVPKITEEEYVAYLSSLRELTEGENPALSVSARERSVVQSQEKIE